jgi:hypothetical protein
MVRYTVIAFTCKHKETTKHQVEISGNLADTQTTYAPNADMERMSRTHAHTSHYRQLPTTTEGTL